MTDYGKRSCSIFRLCVCTFLHHIKYNYRSVIVFDPNMIPFFIWMKQSFTIVLLRERERERERERDHYALRTPPPV